ncbi:MAG: VOC family protein [Bacteroidales bacterium]|nr:VOC family protein [Bacteroidales bacterium]NLM92920.1 hypothetical protein [Bacteroidales bacterium]
MEFHHFGLAVFDFEPAAGFFKRLGYRIGFPVADPLQNVELVMCTSDNQPGVELIKALNEESPVWPFLRKNNEMIYHACYRVKNIQQAMQEQFNGLRVITISPPKPAIMFLGGTVAFYFVKGIGLIELLEINH